MRVSFLILLMLTLTACDLPSQTRPTLTPTRSLSAPPIQASPSPVILSSDELYKDDNGAFVGQSNPTIAALPVDGDLPPVRVGDSENVVDVVLTDGSVLFGDLYQTGEERRPGILLVGSDRASWGTLPLELQSVGFTVLVMEIGAVPQAQHVETMLRTFINVGTVDPARIGVIGEAQGADIVMLACAVEELCDVVALLSPLSRDTLLNIIPSYGTRPLLVASSNQDAEAYPTALMLSQTAQGDTRFIETDAGRGAGLMQFKPDLSGELVAWFETYIGV
jgi:hypothetical protein